MSYRLLTIAVLLLIAPAGCCHPCCPSACSQVRCSDDAGCAPLHGGQAHHGCSPLGGLRGRLQGKLAHMHSWFQPPRPVEITPPLPRFHPVPARPVFEYPPEGIAPVSAQVPQPLP